MNEALDFSFFSIIFHALSCAWIYISFTNFLFVLIIHFIGSYFFILDMKGKNRLKKEGDFRISYEILKQQGSEIAANKQKTKSKSVSRFLKNWNFSS